MIRNLINLGLLLALSACSGLPGFLNNTRSTDMNATPQGVSPLVYVGTYTEDSQGQNRADGIFVYRMDPATGALTQVSKTGGLPNPSFLTIDPSGRYLIAVSETAQYQGQTGGAISSYAINKTTGALTLINSQAALGAATCYVSVDPSGNWVLVANYSGGNVAVLPLGDDGRLGPASDLVQHQGSSVNKSRQEGPHAHSVILAPGSKTLVMVADLGLDKIMLYDLDTAKGKLVPHATPWINIHPGAGPRHMAFTPDGQTLYVINEVDSSVTTFHYDASKGTFSELQNLSLLPADFTAYNYSADIHVTPSGKFLYASNRGNDSLAEFAIDGSTGKLTPIGHVSTQGKIPRNFAIDPTGRFLLAANQETGNIVTFRIDPTTGQLTPAGPVTQLSAPVCVKFFVP